VVAASTPKHLDLLAIGGTEPPKTILNKVSVDMTSEAFWQSGLDAAREMMEHLEGTMQVPRWKSYAFIESTPASRVRQMPRSLGHRLVLHASAPVHLKTQRLSSNDVLVVTVSTSAAGCTTKITRARARSHGHRTESDAKFGSAHGSTP
jgi:hypothetical protein